ncbi:MAG: substrate-binding domain-containing protein [Spirochaetales bacterium]|nr:substrate-binding domain-containing protein [Spirochaetales bacterium]
MNHIVKFFPIVFGVLLAVLLLLTFQSTFKNPFFSMKEGKPQEELSYHFAFYLPDSDYSFTENFKKGVIEAGEALKCGITFHSIEEEPLSLEMAAYSGIDGIAIYPFQKSSNILEYVNKIIDEGIPVVQIENEIIRNENSFQIGTNYFETGKAIGNMALILNEDKINIAIIYSDKTPGLSSDNNLIEMGIINVLGTRAGTLTTKRTSLNPLDAERLTYELLRESNNIDVIVLTDPNDTLVTVQAIIDMNMVGSVQIIGSGDAPKIKEYIEKGVILGSIVRNPYRIGFSSVMALREINLIGYTSAYVDTGISVITKRSKE